jgi:redox-sensitive bicupin YhaK (pirin superfamily)
MKMVMTKQQWIEAGTKAGWMKRSFLDNDNFDDMPSYEHAKRNILETIDDIARQAPELGAMIKKHTHFNDDTMTFVYDGPKFEFSEGTLDDLREVAGTKTDQIKQAHELPNH